MFQHILGLPLLRPTINFARKTLIWKDNNQQSNLCTFNDYAALETFKKRCREEAGHCHIKCRRVNSRTNPIPSWPSNKKKHQNSIGYLRNWKIKYISFRGHETGTLKLTNSVRRDVRESCRKEKNFRTKKLLHKN